MSTSLQDLKVQALEFMSDFLSRYVKGRGVASAAWREDLAPELGRLAAKLGAMARVEERKAERMRELAPSRSARKQMRGRPVRAPLRKVGARSKREAKTWHAARFAALERAGQKCERCVYDPWMAHCTSREIPMNLEVHHRKARSRCTAAEKHDLSNLVVLCESCHRTVTDHACADWASWITTTKPARVGAAS